MSNIKKTIIRAKARHADYNYLGSLPGRHLLAALLIVIFAFIGSYLFILSHAASSLSADFNNDGTVNIYDLSILASNWGKTSASKSTGDANNDGTVNIYDLSILASEWGQSVSTQLPTVNFNASPTTINPGQSATLTWSTTDATSCTASGGWSGNEATSGSASTGALSSTGNYTLSCTGAGGTASQSITVTVGTGTTYTISSSSDIDAVFANAKAGDTIYFPAGVYTHGTLIIKDGLNVEGAGIYNQGVSGGGGGTWLQFAIQWGSNITVSNMLVGINAAGKTTSFRPVARGSAAAGTDTQTNGSHNVTFSYVRFKGGSDSGAALLDLGGNWSGDSGGGWGASLKTIDMVDTTFNDCEFERPQADNSVGVSATFPGGAPGAVINIWADVRSGGAQVHDVHFNRCHFGVKNGYHSGIDGYGIGTTILIQPAPTGNSTGPSTDGGSDITSANWNPSFDWSQIQHGIYNITFTDDLFEYSTWYPADFCDFARNYSMWQGTYDYVHHLNGVTQDNGGSQEGWGNPPGSKYTLIPSAVWLDSVQLTRDYFKGSYPTSHSVVGEIGRDFTVTDVFNGTGSTFNQAGKDGNVASGTFTNADRPHTSLFPTDWSGSTTTYTPSPYDP